MNLFSDRSVQIASRQIQCRLRCFLFCGCPGVVFFRFAPVGQFGTEAKRVGWHAQHISLCTSDDFYIRGHSGQQFAVFIVHVDDDEIADHILRFDGRLADLPHFGAEYIIGVTVDGEGYILAFDNLADVRFVNRCLDLHLGGVGRDFEQVWRLETGGDGGARFNKFIDDDPAGGRHNHGAVQVEPC